MADAPRVRLSGYGSAGNAGNALRFGTRRAYICFVRTPPLPLPFAASLMMTELAWASWETIMRRSMMMAQNTCSAAEYNRMVAEKAAAAWDIGRVLASPVGVTAEALLKPLHSRATANAKRLRRR